MRGAGPPLRINYIGRQIYPRHRVRNFLSVRDCSHFQGSLRDLRGEDLADRGRDLFSGKYVALVW